MDELVGILVVDNNKWDMNQLDLKKLDLSQSIPELETRYGTSGIFEKLPVNSTYIPLCNKQVMKLGRSKDSCQFVINDPIISRLQLIIWSIQFDSNTTPLVYIHDISTNDICVNGSKLTKHNTQLLNHQDTITFGGKYQLKFISPLPPYYCSSLITINDWSISSSFLGSGAYGSVYIATPNNNPGKYYAVKIIKNLSNLILSQNMIEESNILKKIIHPNIIRVYDSCTFGDNLYIFQKLVHGGDLFSYISKGAKLVPLPEKEILVIVYQILKILDYLHFNLGIIHRDLKLDNLLMEIPLPYSKIYLCDFGIAKKLHSLTQRTNTLVGTLEYSAPEIFDHKNLTSYNYKCDMWSLGVIVYILCSGISPFFSENKLVGSKKKTSFNHVKHLSIRQFDNISLGGKDFITKLIRVNANERMDTKACFNHPWISANSHLLERVYQERILLSD